MSGKIRRVLTNIGLVLFGVILALTVAELVLRAITPKTYATTPGVLQDPLIQWAQQWKNVPTKILAEPDPLLGWRHIPNAKGWHITSEYSVLVSFNSKGIRGPEYTYDKSKGEYRIFILGDSFAEGYTVEFSELFSTVLEEKLNERQDRFYQVLNAGTGGYSTDQELLLFQDEGIKYSPDLTILMFYYNDVWDNNQPRIWTGSKPHFTLENGELVPANALVIEQDVEVKQTDKNEPKEESLSMRMKKWLNTKSYLYRFVSSKIMGSPSLYRLAVKLGWAEYTEPEQQETEQTSQIPDKFRVWKTTYDDDINYCWRLTEALILKLREEAASIDGRLLVFYIPSRATIYEEEWEATKKEYAMADEQWNIEQDRIELQSICRENNIDLVDPTEQMRVEASKIAKEGRRLYFIIDGHWTSEGHKLVGELLAEYIITNYLDSQE